MFPILPFYHPTTVAFIDDNYTFLSSLQLFAPDNMPTKFFYSPQTALDWVNRLPPRPSPAEKCFFSANDSVQFDLSALEREITSPERFARVSVMVVDYAMPEMDGLEFCAEVKDQDIRKVLLTGVADEEIAVDAFNRGLIDRFVPKAGLSNVREVFHHVEALQREYFKQQGRSINAGLMNDAQPAVWVNELREYFDQLCRDYGTVEFYLVSKPKGYLLLNRDGQTTRIIIMTDHELEQEAARCAAYGAPEPINAALASGRKIPFLMEDPEDYPEGANYPWEEVLYDSHRVGSYHVAAADNPPADIDFDKASASYAGWMQPKGDIGT